MAVLTGWPTDGAEGSVATEARWRAMAKLWAPSGVVAGFGGELAPTLGAGVINVAAGAAWVDGHYTELTSSASEANSANGLLVVRFTPADNLFELVYRDGATTPTQSDATWELPIASMTAGAMTDLRKLTTTADVGFSSFNLSALPLASNTTYSFYVPAGVTWSSAEWTRTGTQWVTTRSGTYFVSCQAQYAAQAGGRRGAAVSVNLEVAGFRVRTQVSFGDGATIVGASGLLRLNPGDGLRVGVVQNSGSSINLDGATLEAHRLGGRIG